MTPSNPSKTPSKPTGSAATSTPSAAAKKAPTGATGTSAQTPTPVALVVARHTAHLSERLTVVGGSLWVADHPIVRKHPDLFRNAAEVAIRP